MSIQGGLYGIRASRGDRSYQVDCHGCDRPDSARRLEQGDGSPCKHRLAVQLHCARVNGRKAQLEEARKRRQPQRPKLTTAEANLILFGVQA